MFRLPFLFLAGVNAELEEEDRWRRRTLSVMFSSGPFNGLLPRAFFFSPFTGNNPLVPEVNLTGSVRDPTGGLRREGLIQDLRF